MPKPNTWLSNKKQANCVSPCLLGVFSTLDLYVFNTPATICVCCTPLTASIPSRGNTAVWENLAYWGIEESMTCNMIRRMHMVVIFTSTTGTSRHTGCGDSTCCNMPFRLKNKKGLTAITVLTVLAVIPVNAPVSFVVLLFCYNVPFDTDEGGAWRVVFCFNEAT